MEGYEGEISDALEKAAESFYEAFEYKKENPAEKNGTQISGRQEELWKVTPDQVLYLQKKDSQSSELICSGDDLETIDKTINRADSLFPVPDITLIGEPVTMGSLAAAIEQKCGKKFSFSARWRSQKDSSAGEMKPSAGKKPWKKN